LVVTVNGAESADEPLEFLARTRNVYEVDVVRPEITAFGMSAGTTALDPVRLTS
jgi:hypothetical protein